MHRFSFLVTTLLVAVLALSSAPFTVAQASAVAQETETHGIQIADMDLSVDPAQDFYQFANGGWLAGIEIPADSASFGVFDALMQQTMDQQLAQLDALIASNDLVEGSDEWKAVRFFEQGIDMDTRNAQGIGPVQAQLDIIASATDLEHLHELMASPAFTGIPDLFGAAITADPGDSTVNTIWLAGPQLGLPDVTYYTRDSGANAAVREAYKQSVAQFFQLTGMTEADATAAAQAVYDFEASLAADMVTPVEAQDFSVIYNPTTLDEMQALYPALDWQAYLTAAGATVDGSSVVIDGEQRLMQNLATILESTDLQTIQDYLSLRVLLIAAPYLDQQVRDISFGYQQALYGFQQQRSVEQYALSAVNSLMPEAMGQLYVAEYFSPEAKADIEQLVDNLLAVFRVRLENNTWMSPETKTAALEKLDAMKVKVGYPDTWKSYEHYSIGDSFWATVFDSLVAEGRQQMSDYGKPVDRDRWWMSPQMVNAGYDPSKNDITFPAAILQAPFYDAEADPASNYGGIGYAIGHEITHAFDLSGSQFDKDGNYANWWTDADLAAFDALNNEIVSLYDKIEVLPDLFVDGQLTVTENVADLGGLQAAFDALQLALADQGDPGEIDGLTQEQRFFIAAAQVWRQKIRDEALHSLVQIDRHAPAVARASVPAENMDAFYEAFDIQPGDPMYLPPEERVVIW